MATTTKREYPPLLSAGLHEMPLPDLRTLCVDSFPLSQRRDPIMRSLESMILALSVTLLQSAVWIDGSFLTQKIEPDDVDLVVALQHVNGNDTPAQRAVLQRIVNQNFSFPIQCDSYVLVEYPTGHPSYWFGEYMRAYWIRQLGFARGRTLKGIAVVRTP